MLGLLPFLSVSLFASQPPLGEQPPLLFFLSWNGLPHHRPRVTWPNSIWTLETMSKANPPFRWPPWALSHYREQVQRIWKLLRQHCPAQETQESWWTWAAELRKAHWLKWVGSAPGRPREDSACPGSSQMMPLVPGGPQCRRGNMPIQGASETEPMQFDELQSREGEEREA